ncbi:hypothetical protein DMN91_005124 [Ooceraea biroi]|uniref:Uncharacterized protein n=1 Tax=Ooceraea biroi TaxID=2015173 RepID=A0A3L8DRC2_OOCBI|nr:uncharacterized protein LOC105287686 isoform X2 [Ooceraea biroi]XP_019889901.1 uncharacterized protein LOC105287686 isoform X2 [Ooceraea biroi]RLU22846.1 hypothetical protein DMN91_005124 [Ooceraea biroi]
MYNKQGVALASRILGESSIRFKDSILNFCLSHFSPRKALTEFFQSLRTKKQPPKQNVQHYHMHYYPMPLTLLGWMKAPDKQELDKLYEDRLTSFGWTDYHYKFSPDPSIIMSGFPPLWDDTDLWNEEITGPDNVRATIDRNAKGILLRVPVNQQFVLHLMKKRGQKETAV